MKIKNIAAICKKNKYAVIYERYTEGGGVVQYIGDGAAATDKTAKCTLYYTPETDGLSQSWDRGGAVFCNPPYGREIGKWVQKAFEEARGGVSDCFTYPSADRHSIFSRLHLRESGNPLRARAATVHGRRRERRRSRALPFNGSYL